MFLGTYAPRLDDKSRLVLPAKFREQLAEGLVITKGQERCLCVWPLEGFRALTEDLRAAPLTSKGARDYMRVLFAGMCPVHAWWDRSMDAVRTGAIDPLPIISHVLPLDEAPTGYELFDSRRATKVVLKP